jgi:hypothetical protein
MQVISAEKDKDFDKNALINVTIRARQLDWQRLESLWEGRMMGRAPINMHHYDTPGNLGFDPKVQCIYYCSVYSHEELKFNAFLTEMKALEDLKIKGENEVYQAESMLKMLKGWM